MPLEKQIDLSQARRDVKTNNTNNEKSTDSIMVAERPVDQIQSLVQELASKFMVLEDNV